MKCSTSTFLIGLALGALTGMYAERYSRTTSRGRKIRREVNRTLRDIYGSAEQELGRLKEKVRGTVEDATDLVNDVKAEIAESQKN